MQLLVNIDHVATLRNARGEGYPNPTKAAEICERAGAAGIVFHLREDRRHIRDEDVHALKKVITGTIDFEMAATDEMLRISRQVQPDLVTLVPESREELTTEGGLHLATLFDDFKERVFPQMEDKEIDISLFIDPNVEDVQRAHELGSQAVELHTGTYANARSKNSQQFELQRLAEAAQKAHGVGMNVNAGHGLNLQNLPAFVDAVPHLNDVSIGHALIATALFDGLETTVKKFRSVMNLK